jgi:hypothetical protein
VGGSLSGSADDDRDVLVHAEPWRGTGSVPPPLLFPPANSAQLYTPMNVKTLVLHDIYSSGLTHAIFSRCRDNRWHQTTSWTAHPAHHRTSLAAYLVDDFLVVLVILIQIQT